MPPTLKHVHIQVSELQFLQSLSCGKTNLTDLMLDTHGKEKSKWDPFNIAIVFPTQQRGGMVSKETLLVFKKPQ